MSKLKMFLMHCLTGADNETADIGRVLWALSFLIGMGIELAAFYTGRAFDLQSYGIGVGALMAGSGGALMLKAKTEPSA
jgi:hypothetical protein